jgi:hypothetical protein
MFKMDEIRFPEPDSSIYLDIHKMFFRINEPILWVFLPLALFRAGLICASITSCNAPICDDPRPSQTLPSGPFPQVDPPQ